MKATQLLILLQLLFPVLAFAEVKIDDIVGVYKHRFQNGLVDGTKYQSEDILELVKYSDSAVYFRVKLDFYNGHQCNLAGIAASSKNVLHFRDADNKCNLEISVSGTEVLLQDVSENKCHDYCGMRGSLNNVKFDRKLIKPIKYMSVILKSQEYKKASEDFKWALDPQFKVENWPNGKMKSKEPIVNGVPHGISNYFREDGTPAEETTFVRGEKFGPDKKYDTAGKLAEYRNFAKNDRLAFSAKFDGSGKVSEITMWSEVTKCAQPVTFTDDETILQMRCDGRLPEPNH